MLRNKAIALVTIINFLFLTVVPGFGDNRDRTITVMTYNMYPGTEFSGIFLAQTPEELVAEVAEAFTDVQAGNVPERVDEIADQIAAGSPHLVGLQEVALWRYGFPQDPAPATTVAYDFLELLLDGLEARGQHYVPIVIQTNLDAELTAVFSPTSALDVRYTDRLVILARTDLTTSELKIEGTEGRHFAVNFAVPVLGTIVTVYRGWTSADVKHRGKTYRFINAHVESFYEPVQRAQIAELIQRTSNSEIPIILAGDFNSDAEANGVAYNMLRNAGFADVWDLMPQSEPGYTWALSEEIPNVIAIPTQRLDLILTRGMIEHTSVDILGENLATDLTPSGFRPSDHAAVKASFVLQP